ncbi:MAG: hypothetical protein M3R01_15000, partial [Actinomycetota bacterium]|nr:hypothetical protein [Actinomycetota bacterium]
MNDDDVALLAEQRAYYRARAPEYDQWWLRSGRYALPGEERDRWRAEIALLEQAFDEFAPRGEVLELACGTGLWTSRLVRFADRVTAGRPPRGPRLGRHRDEHRPLLHVGVRRPNGAPMTTVLVTGAAGYIGSHT